MLQRLATAGMLRHYPSMEPPAFEPLRFRRRPADEMLRRARECHAELAARRTTRHFSTEYLLLPIGYPAEQAQVPAIRRKPIEDILRWNLG